MRTNGISVPHRHADDQHSADDSIVAFPSTDPGSPSRRRQGQRRQHHERRRPVPFYLQWMVGLAVTSMVRMVWNSAIVTEEMNMQANYYTTDTNINMMLSSRGRIDNRMTHTLLRSPLSSSMANHHHQRRISSMVHDTYSGSTSRDASNTHPSHYYSFLSSQKMDRGGKSTVHFPQRPPLVSTRTLSTLNDDGTASSWSLFPSLSVTTLAPSIIANMNHPSRSRSNRRGTKSATRRFIISGILSHPLGAELALALSSLDAHILGLSDHPVTVLECRRLEFLMQRIPNLEVKITKYPMGGFKMERLLRDFMPTNVVHFEPNTFEQGRINALIHEPQTAHIHARASMRQLDILCRAIVRLRNHQNVVGKPNLHPSFLYVTNKQDRYMSSSSSENYFDDHHRSTFLSMMSSLLHRQSIQLQTYHTRYKLTAIQLVLPEIYGPFQEGADWFDDEFLTKVFSLLPTITLGENNRTTTAATATNYFTSLTSSWLPNNSMDNVQSTRQLIHISDALMLTLDIAMNGIVPLQGATNTTTNTTDSIYPQYPMFAPTNTQTRTLDELIHLFGGTLNSKTINSDSNVIGSMLSWRHKVVMPYQSVVQSNSADVIAERDATIDALTSTRHQLQESQSRDASGVSQLERRQDSLFPCSSECANYVNCQPSVWDSVIPRTKEITSDCRYMLYMTDFTPTLEELPLINDGPNNTVWPRHMFCQVAFVSSKSPLVQRALEMEQLVDGEDDPSNKDGDKDDESKEEADSDPNGRLVSNGWRLIWTDQDSQSLSEADYTMPKILPGSFVGTNMFKAMYLEPQHVASIPSKFVMWFLMGRKLDALAKKAMTRLGGNDEMVVVPAVPARSMSLFGHTHDSDYDYDYDYDKDQKKSSNFNRGNVDGDNRLTFAQTKYTKGVAEYILQQKGMSLARRGTYSSWPNRQLQAYNEAIRWYDGTARLRLADTFFIVHHIRDDSVSRCLRCEWYEEQLFWSNSTDLSSGNKTGPNRDLEDLSLSYVLHRRRREGRLIPDEKWGEKIQRNVEALQASKQPESLESNAVERDYFVMLRERMKSRRVY